MKPKRDRLSVKISEQDLELEPELDSEQDSVQDQEQLSEEEQARQAYHAAVRLLGSRDHSEYELTGKLASRDHTDQAIQSALDELRQLNYVNDERYAQLYTEQRLSRGYGPLSVRSKLRERGVSSALVDAALADQPVSWAELAQAALENRFGVDVIVSTEQRDQARIARFLASRGFASSDALRALNTARKALSRQNTS